MGMLTLCTLNELRIPLRYPTLLQPRSATATCLVRFCTSAAGNSRSMILKVLYLPALDAIERGLEPGASATFTFSSESLVVVALPLVLVLFISAKRAVGRLGQQW